MQLSAFALSAALMAATPVAAEAPVSSTLLRTAIFVKDRPATVAFFHNVMGYFRDDTPLIEMILNEQEQNVRSVMAKMESGFIRRLAEFQHE